MGEAERIAERYQRRKILPAGRYSMFDPGNLFIIHQRERLLLRLLRKHGLANLAGATLLEVGCGDGWWLRRFVEYGFRPENLRGIELLPERVERAMFLSPNIRIESGDASCLALPDGSFDIIFQSTVFSSMLDTAMRRETAKEMLRVLRPGGMIIWYDLRVNNPSNPDVKGLGRREIESLFPGCCYCFHRTTLAPPLARTLAPVSWLLCHLLSRLPLLLTHYLAFISKPAF
jgi:SAM-dependent methyltransferase